MSQNKNQTNFSQEKDLKIEDFPIHTMKKDLQEINNPAKTPEYAPRSMPAPPAMSKKETPDNKNQASSPFLQKIYVPEKDSLHFPQPPSSLPIQTKPAAIIPSIKEPISVIQFPQQDSARSGKILNVLLAISLLLAVFGGSYYAWYTGSFSGLSSRFSFTGILSKLGIGHSPKITPVLPVSPEIPKYSSDKPNYLNIDIENADKLKIEESLKKYTAEINTLGISAPIEFIVVDLQNNPVSFSDFSAKAGINLSSSITNQLENTFSLFIYNDNNIPKIGLAIPTQNATKLKESLLPAEKTLSEALNPLFLSQKIIFDNRPFNDSVYDGFSIRYKNSTPEFSVDYSIINDKFIIGTSKMTLRAILDYQKKK